MKEKEEIHIQIHLSNFKSLCRTRKITLNLKGREWEELGIEGTGVGVKGL